jgi:uncharacterized protein
MSAFLLDVNVLVALLWPTHNLHLRAQRWFAAHSKHGWATCPLTEAGFVRITSNPAFSSDALATQEALDLLSTNLGTRSHRFWPDEISLADAVKALGINLSGHQQVTGAYLLGLASHHRGKLATLDNSLASLLPPDSPALNRIELIQ